MNKRLFDAGQDVICINDDFTWSRMRYPQVKNYPVFGQRYVVRGYVCDGKIPAIVLREFTNIRVPYMDGVIREAGFADTRFVATSPPSVVRKSREMEEVS